MVGKVPVVKADVLVAYIAPPLLNEAMPVPPWSVPSVPVLVRFLEASVNTPLDAVNADKVVAPVMVAVPPMVVLPVTVKFVPMVPAPLILKLVLACWVVPLFT